MWMTGTSQAPGWCSSILGMHPASPGPLQQDKLYLRTGGVGQQVINCSQGNLLKATVDFKLSPDWLKKGHNTVIKLSITKDRNLYGDSILQKNLEHLWGKVSKTWSPEKSVVSNIEINKEKRRPRSCQCDVIEREKKGRIRFLETWRKWRSKEDMMRRGEIPRCPNQGVKTISGTEGVYEFLA